MVISSANIGRNEFGRYLADSGRYNFTIDFRYTVYDLQLGQHRDASAETVSADIQPTKADATLSLNIWKGVEIYQNKVPHCANVRRSGSIQILLTLSIVFSRTTPWVGGKCVQYLVWADFQLTGCILNPDLRTVAVHEVHDIHRGPLRSTAVKRGGRTTSAF